MLSIALCRVNAFEITNANHFSISYWLYHCIFPVYSFVCCKSLLQSTEKMWTVTSELHDHVYYQKYVYAVASGFYYSHCYRCNAHCSWLWFWKWLYNWRCLSMKRLLSFFAKIISIIKMLPNKENNWLLLAALKFFRLCYQTSTAIFTPSRCLFRAPVWHIQQHVIKCSIII